MINKDWQCNCAGDEKVLCKGCYKKKPLVFVVFTNTFDGTWKRICADCLVSVQSYAKLTWKALNSLEGEQCFKKMQKISWK